MKMNGRYHLQRIKRDYPYMVTEICEMFQVHKNTVRHWIREGLPVIDQRRPILIHSNDLLAFLQSKQGKRKATCQPNEMYCFRCRQPRSTLNGQADLLLLNEKLAKLMAFCGICENRMSRAISRSKLSKFQEALVIQTPETESITDCLEAGVDCHLLERGGYGQIQPAE